MKAGQKIVRVSKFQKWPALGQVNYRNSYIPVKHDFLSSKYALIYYMIGTLLYGVYLKETNFIKILCP